MPNLLWSVRHIETVERGQVLKGSTTIYANSEAEARINGAAALGVPVSQVQVQQIPAYNPTDDELRAEWGEARKQLEAQTENMKPTGGGAYG